MNNKLLMRTKAQAEHRKPGRPRKGEEKGDNITISRGSTGRAYILARLDRDGHAELAASKQMAAA